MAAQNDICINFFARELNNVLISKGLTLWALRQAGIQSAQIDRLRKGLGLPGNYHMLNPDDMQKVIRTFRLSSQEVMRIRAAIPATSIMQTLMERIYLESAYQVADQIYKYILQAMQKGKAPYSNIRNQAPFAQALSHEEVLDAILPWIDRASMAEQMSREVSDSLLLEYLVQARVCYTAALRHLNEAPGEVKQMEAWKQWQAEAQKRLAEVEDILQDYQ
ncbi:MAG TPA: hypothetical protein VFA41_04790 [Ktedonobacteraceae bacterium]|jgi:hypothetical protein|nr:hypothetical protein [Ktedonobacteraceae bacterium]